MKIKKLLLLMLMILLVCGQTTAYAADRKSDSQWIITEGEQTVDMTGFRDEVLRDYRMFQSVSTAIAGVSVAVSAFQLLQGGDQNAERAKRTIIWALMAAAVVNVLPEVIGIGVTLGRQYAWTPTG